MSAFSISELLIVPTWFVSLTRWSLSGRSKKLQIIGVCNKAAIFFFLFSAPYFWIRSILLSTDDFWCLPGLPWERWGILDCSGRTYQWRNHSRQGSASESVREVSVLAQNRQSLLTSIMRKCVINNSSVPALCLHFRHQLCMSAPQHRCLPSRNHKSTYGIPRMCKFSRELIW